MDLIERQTAIDAIEQMQMPIMRSERSEEQFLFAGMSEALNAIKELPSAQPEIIRCKDCKFWTHIKRTNRYWCKTDDGLYDLNPSPDDYCSRAERRKDG